MSFPLFALAMASSAVAQSPASPAPATPVVGAPASPTPAVKPAPPKPKRAEKKEEPRPAPRVLSTAPALPSALKAGLIEAVNDPALDNADLGFLAVRLRDGVVLAEYGGDALINPASNAKLITSSAALDTLKAEYRFKTEYYVQGTLKDGVLYGNLIVKGYGDPTIVSERINHVVNELYLYGVERVTGSVIVDGSWFDNVEEARGWELEEAPDRAYAAPVSALAVNYNATAVYVRPTEPGKPAIVKIDPPCEHVVVQGEVTTEALGAGVKVVSDEQKDEVGRTTTLITVEGSVSPRDAPFRVYRRVYGPEKHFGSVLVSLMQQRGIKVAHRVIEGRVPEGAKLILVDRSPTLTEVLADLNHYSNNIIAETLIKTMGAEVMGAPGSFKNGLAVSHAFLENKVGLKKGSYVFENGSGLNDVNRFTPRQLVQLLTYMAKDFEGGHELVTSLAIAGTQGTIHFRMRDTPAERHLRAKTGTLRGVSALSGYVVQPNGEVVVFSFLSQGFKNGASTVWKVQNTVGIALASDGKWRPEEDVEPAVEGEAVSTSTPAPTETSPGGAP
jgi:D-alanyl-D-alanine carboxypeptidase/D-alanyl-D-alanine-endopeptidase (penicillin-binding protein 4)